MIMPTTYLANWDAINQRRTQQTQQNMERENRLRIAHEFRLNDKVLIRRDIGNPFLGRLARPTEGPFKIIDIEQLPINGTVLIERDRQSTERVNIRRLIPFIEPTN